MPTKLEHALQLARNGFYVFPCEPNGKLPAMPWRDASSRNPETIKNWFICPTTGWKQDYNIGIDCAKSGLTVVDVDTKTGKKGKESYEKLDEKFGWPDTLTIKTPSGGVHLYYAGGGFRNTQGDNGGLDAGIDTRGEGGFVVAPGSVIADKKYSVFRDSPIAPIPEWLGDKLKSHKHDPLQPHNGGKTIIADQEDDIQSAIEFLQSHEPAVEGHGGDHHTFVTFCMLKERGISCAKAIELAEEHWNPECSPPWDYADLVAKANSAYKSAQNATGAKSPHAVFEAPAEPIPPKKPSKIFPAGHTIRQASEIPRRDWVFGDMFLAKQVGMLIAEPGIGKSTWSLGMALSLTTNKSLLGIDPHGGAAVGLFNNEDNLEEMDRRLRAAMQHYGIRDDEYHYPRVTEKGSRLFLCGRENPLRLAFRNKDGVIKGQDALPLIDWTLENQIRMLVLDPFSMTHPANENSNEEILRVGEICNYVADKTNAAVVLIHHTRKRDKASSEGHSGNLDSARGASSLGGLVRSAYTLDTISAQVAKQRGIAEKERKLYVMLQQAKANMAAPQEDTRFYKRHGEIIGRTLDNEIGENVGILLPVNLKELADPALRVLLQDIEMLVGEQELTIPELTQQLLNLPFHHDKQPSAMTKTLQRLFSAGLVTGFTGVLHYEERESVGGCKPSKFIRLEVTTKDSMADII